MTFEPKITLGGLLTAILIVAGGILTIGQMTAKFDAMANQMQAFEKALDHQTRRIDSIFERGKIMP